MTPPRQADHERVTLASLLAEPLLRACTVFADDDALERPVSWCLPWSVASRGAETVQHMLVHVDEDLSPAVLDALCREVPTLTARGVSALAVNASEPGELLRKAACAAGLPVLGLPEHTAHLALSHLVAEKNLANAAHVLRYGVTVHHALGEVLYRGAGLSAMANQIRRLSGCSVLMLDTHLEFLETDLIGVEPSLAEEAAATVRGSITSGELVIDPRHGKATAVTVPTSAREVTVVTAPIVLGGTNYGWLLLLEREHPPHRHDLAQHLVLAGEAATITGSEMLRLRSVEAAVERARGDFVHALLHARFSNPHEVASRASYHGFDVGAVYGVIALSGAFDTSTPAGLERQGSLLLAVRRQCPASGQPVLATAVGDLLVVVAQLGPGLSRDVPAEQAMLAAFGRDLFGEVSRRVRREVLAAFGRPAIGPAGVAASYREARVALGIAQRLGLREPCGYAELRSFAALADLTHSQHALTFAHDVLEPLRSRDSAGDGLLTVVLTYIGSGGNVNAAARRLHLHRNTLFNKLDRASRLLQLDVREPEAMFRIWLAYRIDLLASVDADVSGELGPAPAARPAGETAGPAQETPAAPAELSANGRRITWSRRSQPDVGILARCGRWGLGSAACRRDRGTARYRPRREGVCVHKRYRIDLDDALPMLAAARAKADEIGVRQTICVCDDGGNVVALHRLPGARLTGVDIAIAKAFTAAGHERATHKFNEPPTGPALPGNEAFGISHMLPGKFAIFVGGFPIEYDGQVVGAVGVSGGNGEQDKAVGAAALDAFAKHIAEAGIRD